MTRRSQRVVYENPWMQVTEDAIVDADGNASTYAVLHAPDFAVVVAYDGERYHLVEQFRYPVGRRAWEFPQGAVHQEAPITPEAVAARELAEETGLRAGRFERLGFLHETYGRSVSGFTAFLATDLTPGEPDREPGEADMRTGWFTMEEIWAMVDDGRITDASTVAALALLDRHRAQSQPDPTRS